MFRPNYSVYLDYGLQKNAALHRNNHGRACLDTQEYKSKPPAGMNQRADRETSCRVVATAVTLAHLKV